MSRAPTVIRHYEQQHYTSLFNPETGFFARIEDPGYSEPFWSQLGPELLDIAITNWCDRGCEFCYRKSSLAGQHMSVRQYETIMRQALRIQVLQVALGGGNPNQHPDFCEIVRLTREEYGIVPNYTTNGRGLTQQVLKATRMHCGAVAVSAYYPYDETARAITYLTSYGIKTNIHFILSSQTLPTAIRWLQSPPTFMKDVNAIIFLNYKPIGRYNSPDLLLRHAEGMEQLFGLTETNDCEFKIGFDACSVTGIARFTNLPHVCYDGCDAGRFSMFISEDMKMYPCSFLVEAGFNGAPLGEDNLQDFWQNGDSMNRIRQMLSSHNCAECPKAQVCRGGCPFFPEINLCPDGPRSCEASSEEN
jgi:radical SAM protein with 4Fe4S-binding SPASM domain